MKLIIFAHWPEAKAFFKSYQSKKMPGLPDNLYFFEQISSFILITGEGIFNSSLKTSQALGRFPQISKLINFGISGALNDSIIENEIYQIRTSYMSQVSNGPKMEFKSFSSQSSSNRNIETADCISSNKRILNLEDKDFISSFGDLVDRELWGIAQTCHAYKIPFESYKLVSDKANSTDICESIREVSDEYSLKLLHFFQDKINDQAINPVNKNSLENVLTHPEIHFTTAQRNYFKKITTDLANQKSIEEKIQVLIEKEVKLKTTKKTISKKIIALIEKYKFPHLHQTNINAKKLFAPYLSEKISIKYDEKFENKDLNVNLKISKTEDVEILTRTISNLPLDKWKKILDGEYLDV